MTSRKDSEAAVNRFFPDDPQLMLIGAYARLSALSERLGASEHAIMASYGPYSVRLMRITTAEVIPAVPSLWIELYDYLAGRVIDSAGCRNLDEAETALEAMIAEALRRNGIIPADDPRG